MYCKHSFKLSIFIFYMYQYDFQMTRSKNHRKNCKQLVWAQRPDLAFTAHLQEAFQLDISTQWAPRMVHVYIKIYRINKREYVSSVRQHNSIINNKFSRLIHLYDTHVHKSVKQIIITFIHFSRIHTIKFYIFKRKEKWIFNSKTRGLHGWRSEK